MANIRENFTPEQVEIRVDANGGWSVQDAKHMMQWLADRKVDYIEQPLKEGEEDRLKETLVKQPETPVINSEDIVGEVSRIRLSEEDLAILEKHLLNPEGPNEKLKEAAQRYSDEVREKHTHIDDFNETSVKSELTQEERGEILADMMKNDQEMGLYDDELTVICQVEELPAARIKFSYRIKNDAGELINEGITTLVFMTLANKKVIKAPDFVLNALRPYFEL